ETHLRHRQTSSREPLAPHTAAATSGQFFEVPEYENPWFRVRRAGRWYWVEQAQPVPGAAVLPVTRQGLIIQRHRRVAQGRAETLEIPRGLCEPGETEAQCAARELAEETGLVIAPGALLPLGYCRPDTGLLAARVALFLADLGNLPDLPQAGDGEAEGILRIPPPDLSRWLAEGRIEDSFALAAIALAQARGAI
ncbi:ADP-ribose pyrophosphatase, partial [Phaeovulum veldkampii DSM 11550]